MPLNDLEVERQLTQRRLDTEQFKASINNLTNLINKLQASVNGIVATPTGVVITNGGGGGDSDSYPTAGGIVHRLLHIFQSAVQFLSTISITGIATFVAAPVFSSTTATRPLKVDAGKGLISGRIALNDSVNDVTGTLAIANGGSGTTTPSIIAGTRISVAGSWPNQTISSTVTSQVDINGSSGKIWGGSPQLVAGVATVTPAGFATIISATASVYTANIAVTETIHVTWAGTTVTFSSTNAASTEFISIIIIGT